MRRCRRPVSWVLSTRQLDAILAVNLRAPIVLARALAPVMADRRRGHLVFVPRYRAGSRHPSPLFYSGAVTTDRSSFSIRSASSCTGRSSLASGAIRGLDRRNAYYFELIQALAKHYRFDIETPWSELPPSVQQVVLFGSGTQQIEFRYGEGKGRASKRRHAFEGIVPNLERRYRETESGTVREELAKYLGTRPCPDCEGTRLNCAARFVSVAHQTLPAVAHMTVSAALEFFRSLSLSGWRGEVAAKIVKDVAERLRFLADVGLGYLTLDRNAETLSGGEAQQCTSASQARRVCGLTGVMYILDEPSIGPACISATTGSC